MFGIIKEYLKEDYNKMIERIDEFGFYWFMVESSFRKEPELASILNIYVKKKLNK